MDQMMEDVKKGGAIASGTLTKEEFVNFSDDFRELDVGKFTKITTKSEGNSVKVVLETNEVSGFLLRASLRDGMLRHLNWHKKIQLEN